jgi:hypothetical protein
LACTQRLTGEPQLGFKRVRVLPDYDEKNRPTGTQAIEVLATIAPREGVEQAVVVMEYAKAAIEHIAAMLALARRSSPINGIASGDISLGRSRRVPVAP